jgi:hypothetical protein
MKQHDDGSSAEDTSIQLAKSTSSKGRVFTNRGKADDQETAAKRAQTADRRRAAECVAPLGPAGAALAAS